MNELVLRPSNAVSFQRARNVYNLILDTEREVFTRIEQAGGLEKISCPGAIVYDKPPYLVMPPQGRQFQETASIPLPANNGLDTLVVAWTVPTGYDGVLTSVINMWTGTGFVEGSNDLIWRI